MYRHSQARYSGTAFLTSATCCGMESAQGAGWNHGNAVYGIKPQERYSPKGADGIQGRNAPLMIYAALRASMICQAYGLDKQKRCVISRCCLLVKLEFVLLFSAYNNVCVIGFNYIYDRHCGFFDNQCNIIESIGIHLDFASSHINIFTLVFING